MSDIVSTYSHQYMQNKRHSQRRNILIALVGAIVVIGVAIALSVAGSAMTGGQTVCGLEEHQHTDACYERTLVCGMEEGEGATDAVVETVETTGEDGEAIEVEQVISEATEGHVHTADCYENVLTCGKVEHVHSANCYSMMDVDVETQLEWEATLPQDLQGTWAERLVKVADSQLGYQESALNFMYDNDGITHRGYSRYGDWYGNKYSEWNALFVQFCLFYSNPGQQLIPYSASTRTWALDLSNEGIYTNAEGYTPNVGDIVFFDTKDTNYPDEVGIITKIEQKSVDGQPVKDIITVQGDIEGAVAEVEYPFDDATIDGYIDMTAMSKLAAELEGDPNAVASTNDEPAEGDLAYLEDLFVNEGDIEEVLVPGIFDGQVPSDPAELVAWVNSEISKLPEPAEFNEQLAKLEEDQSWIAADLLYTETYDKVQALIDIINGMPDNLKSQIRGTDKFTEYNWKSSFSIDEDAMGYTVEGFLEADAEGDFPTASEPTIVSKTLSLMSGDAQRAGTDPQRNSAELGDYSSTTINNAIYQVNQIPGSEAAEGRSLLISNGNTSGSKTTASYYSNMSFLYYKAIVVTKNTTEGVWYVTKKYPIGIDKRGSKYGTDKYDPYYIGPQGFMLLYNDKCAGDASLDNIAIGAKLTSVPEALRTNDRKAYNGNSYGTLRFANILPGSLGAEKPSKNNSNLKTVNAADTSNLVEINMYDYNSHINEPYINSSRKDLGFQNPGGTWLTTSGSTVARWNFNFGDNITTDFAAGLDGVTGAGGNKINGSRNGANTALKGAVKNTLGADGYPQSVEGGRSWKYLFENNGYTTSKLNNKSVNFLFQQKDNGEYYYDSRQNHAQFNPGADTFTLYEERISSNAIMYPFGNFLPLNDIRTQAKKSSEIDRGYLEQIQNSAYYKAGSTGDYNYDGLATSLKNFISRMDGYTKGKNGGKGDGKNWNLQSAADYYFELCATGDQALPANMAKTYTIDYDEPTNFFFGMDMQMNFMQPKSGLTGKDGKSPMVFEFAGDDDVLVYIDGMLFMDLSGIHRHVGGRIDCENGTVQYYRYADYENALTTLDKEEAANKDKPKDQWVDLSEPGETMTFEDIIKDAKGSNVNLDDYLVKDSTGKYTTFKNYTEHNFKFFYMERGSGSSVCRINFNFPILPKNSVSVSKHLTADESGQDVLGMDPGPDFTFKALKADANGNPTENVFAPMGANTQYKVLGENGLPLTETIGGVEVPVVRRVNADNTFTLKNGQTALFEGIPADQGKFYVREMASDTFGNQYDITVDISGNVRSKTGEEIFNDETFKGQDSVVIAIDDASSHSFVFENRVNGKSLGKLGISKQIVTADVPSGSIANDQIFHMYVTLNGKPVAANTPYALVATDKDGVPQIEYDDKGKVKSLGPETIGAAKLVVQQDASGNSFVDVKAGYVAILEGILAESEYKVWEAGAAGYNATYYSKFIGDKDGDLDPENASPEGATGKVYFFDKSDIKIITALVQNAEGYIEFNIPLTKTLVGPVSSENGEFTFVAKRIKTSDITEEESAGGASALSINESGDKKITTEKYAYYADGSGVGSIQFSSGDSTSQGTVKVAVPASQANMPGARFYYEITENDNPSTVCDHASWIVELVPSNETLAVSRVWKDKAYVGDGSTVSSFQNFASGDLSISKELEVIDGDPNASGLLDTLFTFSIEFKNAGGSVGNQSYEVTYFDPAAEEADDEPVVLDVVDGQARIQLKSGQSARIKVPFGTMWTVKEIEHDGFYPVAIYDEEEAVLGTDSDSIRDAALTGATTVESSNISLAWKNLYSYELPETGGAGLTAYLTAGMVLVLGAVSMMVLKRNRGRRAGKQAS